VTNAEVMARNAAYEVGVYARQKVAFVRGRGAELWDAEGKRYLDFFAGLSVNNLGHCHPAVVEAVQKQVATLIHASNVYHTVPGGELSALLCEHSFAERVFLCNSGAEANEAAMKLARRWGAKNGGGRYEIIATTGSFPFDDLAAIADAVRDETVAILVEPIQGEGGVVVPRPGYLPGLRELATRKKLLLIFDEIQCGLGRTGRLFAHEHAGITPDVMTLAKALAGGLPIGAMCTTADVAAALTPGSHGSTFGGNPVAAAAGVAAFRALADPALLGHVRAVGAHFRTRLEALAEKHGMIRQVRGMGLMLGAELDRPGAPIVERCLAAGLLINCTAERVLRFLPPLVITRDEVDEGFAVLERALA
jgi:acetylornithine/N-succinyldiaminopimelate aminotransferase